MTSPGAPALARTPTPPPAPTPAPEAPAGDKRDRILQAAIAVFAKKGFYEAKVSEIAKAAGVADGTIYLYFKNKDDVLISIFRERLTDLIQVVEAEVAREQTTEARIRRIVEIQLGRLESRRDLAEVVTVNLRQSSSLLRQYAAPLFSRYLALIASVLADGQARGEVRADVHPRIAARALWGALDGIALTWALDRPTPEALRKAAHQCASLFLGGVLRPAPHDATEVLDTSR